ncbi:ATP-binding cassette domain-containing protein [Erysipelothrix sp. HDW6B]|uniref:ATP-binding cassette domain-containing protein n=1 Tax=Erysipelothrix sp. HDW6B TaxID=2714929 RepID=UPI00140D9C9F|nr:ATP-binding cassette domain-containing protein [Erysipelothrix sp. HDW6B]QIK85935.1 ATP-binding cassette domain-containing protein [Erysipelothrix sp. HDW6B]
MSKDKDVIVSIKDLVVQFGSGKNVFTAVNKVSFDIYRGETFALVGESGSGKTTIGRTIVGINEIADGEIQFEDLQIKRKMAKKDRENIIKNVQMIFQDPAASLNERATVDYIVSEGLHNFKLYKNEEDRIEKVENIIQRVGLLPEHLTRYPHEFSGGQRQRIGIARALVMEPKFVIADEPISALDVSIRAQVLNLLKELQEDKSLTYLFVAHDLSVVRFIADRIAVIHHGVIVELTETEELFRNPIHPYTKSLLSAVPVPDPQVERNKKLIIYKEDMHDYETSKPSFVEIRPGHFVWANEEEVTAYRAELATQ